MRVARSPLRVLCDSFANFAVKCFCPPEPGLLADLSHAGRITNGWWLIADGRLLGGPSRVSSTEYLVASCQKPSPRALRFLCELCGQMLLSARARPSCGSVARWRIANGWWRIADGRLLGEQSRVSSTEYLVASCQKPSSRALRFLCGLCG